MFLVLYFLPECDVASSLKLLLRGGFPAMMDCTLGLQAKKPIAPLSYFYQGILQKWNWLKLHAQYNKTVFPTKRNIQGQFYIYRLRSVQLDASWEGTRTAEK